MGRLIPHISLHHVLSHRGSQATSQTRVEVCGRQRSIAPRQADDSSLAPPPSTLPATTAQTMITLSWLSSYRVSPASPASGPSDPPTPSYPDGRISVTWELVRHTEPQAPPRPPASHPRSNESPRRLPDKHWLTWLLPNRGHHPQQEKCFCLPGTRL